MNTVLCFVCKKTVPKKELTTEAIRLGKGLCSKRCSKIMRKTLGNLIPNRYGTYQVREHRKNNHFKKYILASSFGIHF